MKLNETGKADCMAELMEAAKEYNASFSKVAEAHAHGLEKFEHKALCLGCRQEFLFVVPAEVSATYAILHWMNKGSLCPKCTFERLQRNGMN
jgi:hypothetical protein